MSKLTESELKKIEQEVWGIYNASPVCRTAFSQGAHFLAKLRPDPSGLVGAMKKQLALGCDCSSSTGEFQTKGPDGLCILHEALAAYEASLKGERDAEEHEPDPEMKNWPGLTKWGPDEP